MKIDRDKTDWKAKLQLEALKKVAAAENIPDIKDWLSGEAENKDIGDTEPKGKQ